MTWQEKSGYLRIIEHYGTETQRKKLMEEAYELAEAIQEWECCDPRILDPSNRRDELREHILEEVADVSVLVEEVSEYFNLDRVEVLRVMAEKVARTLERVEA